MKVLICSFIILCFVSVLYRSLHYYQQVTQFAFCMFLHWFFFAATDDRRRTWMS
jgi:hypothetical protein